MSAKIKASELAKVILQSSEFYSLIEAKKIIDRNSSCQNSLKTLKAKEVEFHKIMMPDVNKGKMQAQDLKNYYTQIIQNQDIKKYLEAEKGFNEYVANVLKIINDNIEKSLK